MIPEFSYHCCDEIFLVTWKLGWYPSLVGVDFSSHTQYAESLETWIQ